MLTFSQLYLRPASAQEDSPRMRVQLRSAFYRHLPTDRNKVADFLLNLRGVEVTTNQYHNSYDWDDFFESYSIGDVLDAVTFVHNVLIVVGDDDAPGDWLQVVQQAFDTHNLRYRACEDGVVRLKVDHEFEVGREATLAGLQAARYGGVRREFSEAHRLLAAVQPDLKQAIRAMFEAVEVTFKLMFPAAQRLAAPQLGQHLTPFVAQHYAADRPAQQAAEKLVQGFTDWVASAQFYRHGQGQEEPNQPPLEVAVMILSSGAAHLRWLVHLDQAKLAAGQ